MNAFVAERYLGTIDNGLNMIKKWDPYYVRFAGIKISHVRRKWYEFALRNEQPWSRANPIEKQPDYGGKTPKEFYLEKLAFLGGHHIPLRSGISRKLTIVLICVAFAIFLCITIFLIIPIIQFLRDGVSNYPTWMC